MALQVIEFFGYTPLNQEGSRCAAQRRCPFVESNCIKPKHGACSVQQFSEAEPVICCPNRMYGENFRVLEEIADETFGAGSELVKSTDIATRIASRTINGNEVVVFGRYWGQELPLPRPRGDTATATRKYYVDWILAKLDKFGGLKELTAVEVQTIDTTGNYSDQVRAFFDRQSFTDTQGRNPGYSKAGMNWENVNKRILPQVIYKGHVLRRESKCSKGLYFVCPKQVYDRIRDRLGRNLHTYNPGNGTITFWSYEIGQVVKASQHRPMLRSGQFTTTVDQVAYAFTAPMNLPDQNVYEAAINKIRGR